MAASKEPSIQRRLKLISFRFSVRINYILFPIDYNKLSNALTKGGYSVTSPGPPPTSGARIVFKGQIAKKADNFIDADSDRGIIGVAGFSTKSVLENFQEIKEIIKKDAEVDISENAWFYEILARLELETGQNPLSKIEKISIGPISKFSGILQEDTSLFSIRLAPKGKIPNQEEWFDITIEPDLTRPTSIYSISVVYRSADRSKVQAFGQQLESKISELVEALEV